MAASAGALYLVIGRGWRLGDLGWVTQRAFRQGMTGLSNGIDSLSTRLANVKAHLAARIAEVSRKQDEAAVAAAAMRAHLADVGADVETVRNQVGQLHSTILNMDGEISEIGVNQRHALHGIYILCKAVSELSAGSSIASKTELLEYTKSPIWQRVRPQGLEGILQENTTTSLGESRGHHSGGGGFGGAAGASGGGEDEPWLRHRYMLGTGELGNRNTNTASSNRVEDSSSAGFMKALPTRDSYRSDVGGGGGSNNSGFGAGERGGSAGLYSPNTAAPPSASTYTDIRTRTGGFGLSSPTAAADVRREDRLARNQQRPSGFGTGSDW